MKTAIFILAAGMLAFPAALAAQDPTHSGVERDASVLDQDIRDIKGPIEIPAKTMNWMTTLTSRKANRAATAAPMANGSRKKDPGAAISPMAKTPAATNHNHRHASSTARNVTQSPNVGRGDLRR